MSSLGFSGTNLATVAYAEVDGVAGASTVTNSGVATTRVAGGTYVVVLPTGITQRAARDLIFVQTKTNNDGTSLTVKMAVVDDSLEATKTIVIFDGTQGNEDEFRVDSSFSILILRTTISAPAGAPA